MSVLAMSNRSVCATQVANGLDQKPGGCGSMLWTKESNWTWGNKTKERDGRAFVQFFFFFLVYLPGDMSPEYRNLGYKERDEFGVVDFLSSRFVLYGSKTGQAALSNAIPERKEKKRKKFTLFHIRLIGKPRTHTRVYPY